MAKTIATAIEHKNDTFNTNWERTSSWSTWEVTYKEFEGRYFLDNSEYQLQLKIQELIKSGVKEEDIDILLDLARDVYEHEASMEE